MTKIKQMSNLGVVRKWWPKTALSSKKVALGIMEAMAILEFQLVCISLRLVFVGEVAMRSLSRRGHLGQLGLVLCSHGGRPLLFETNFGKISQKSSNSYKFYFVFILVVSFGMKSVIYRFKIDFVYVFGFFHKSYVQFTNQILRTIFLSRELLLLWKNFLHVCWRILWKIFLQGNHG